MLINLMTYVFLFGIITGNSSVDDTLHISQNHNIQCNGTTRTLLIQPFTVTTLTGDITRLHYALKK